MLITLAALASAMAWPSCHHVSIERMIADYSGMLKRQDSDRIAGLYGSDGVVENPGADPIRGQEAIRKFLSGFHGASVNSSELTIQDVLPSGDNWQVTGQFHQTGLAPGGKPYDAHGSFDSLWTCARTGWQLRRMGTGK